MEFLTFLSILSLCSLAFFVRAAPSQAQDVNLAPAPTPAPAHVPSPSTSSRVAELAGGLAGAALGVGVGAGLAIATLHGDLSPTDAALRIGWTFALGILGGAGGVTLAGDVFQLRGRFSGAFLGGLVGGGLGGMLIAGELAIRNDGDAVPIVSTGLAALSVVIGAMIGYELSAELIAAGTPAGSTARRVHIAPLLAAFPAGGGLVGLSGSF